MDTVGPLPPDEKGNQYILVAVDCFSRFTEMEAVPSDTSIEIAHFILRITGRYGPPLEIQSDRGAPYLGKIIKDLLHLFEIRSRQTLAYRSQVNGMVERANQEVMRHSRPILSDLRVKAHWGK